MYKFKEIRNEFPITKRAIYFDIAYGNPMANSVKNSMIDFLEILQKEGCSIARDIAYDKIKITRKKFADLINADPSEISLIKNTSEGLNIAANGIEYNKGDNVVINELEHLNNTFCWLKLQDRGVETRIIKEKNGRINIEDLATKIDSKTRAVSIASTTNLGFRFDLEEIGKICKEKDVYLVVDAIQSLGIDPLDIKKCKIDMVSSSAHKGLLGPHGIGFFYCNKDIISEINPLSVARTNYKNPENLKNSELKNDGTRFEGGNYNYSGVFGSLEGLNLLSKIEIEDVKEHSFKLAEMFRENLLSMGANVTNSEDREERSHIITYNLPGHEDEEIKKKLKKNNIIVSSHYGVLRASFTHYNTIEEVEKAVSILKSFI